MLQTIDVLFYKFRFLLAGLTALVLLIVFSALITSVGSNSLLDARAGKQSSTSVSYVSDSPNIVTSGAYAATEKTKQTLITAGTNLYGGCRAVTSVSSSLGMGVVHGSAGAVKGVGSAIGFVARGSFSAVAFAFRVQTNALMFVFRLPAKAVHPLTSSQAVSALIRPSEDNPVPVIKTELSPEMVARITAQAQQDAQDQQKVAAEQAAQLAANRGLRGAIVAGDPHHGGYPTKWDTAAQDSMLDSWGMYNRECVSYAAWKVYQTYGNMPFWGGIGNANQWLGNARAAGIATGNTPQVNSVAISMRGYYGHAMWVEKVSGDMVYVSQYNYDLHGHYSEMWVDAGSFSYIYFK